MRTLCLLPLLALAGCSLFWPDNKDEGVVCTLAFVIHTVDVQLPDGTAAEDVQITSTNERTGRVYGPCDDVAGDAFTDGEIGCALGYEPGRYVVYTDAQGGETSRAGDDVTVRGTLGELGFEEAFRFRRGACHVEKLAGPDTVTLR
jgi:hypothetical protein